MREVTKQMIRDYKLREAGMDFAGYEFNQNDATFHHLIVARRNCAKMGLGDGYFKENGAILMRDNHSYFHIIEAKDLDMFYAITSELIDENIKGFLDIDNLRRIHDILTQFEKEHCGDRTRKGKVLIKEAYTRRVKL